MDNVADDLEKLLSDVRKTISDNRQFLDKLLDETAQDESGDETENDATAVTAEEDFEEL
jgi:hypothetical protein